MTRNENEGSLEDEWTICTLLLVFEELKLSLSVDLLLNLLGLCLVAVLMLKVMGGEGSQAKHG
ncbi:hypothetical protein BCEN4_740115 [Burkholderia cenocepacia]|nr:hypothetical protein BCEN4_740115 [Burkholderia cenocepacia]